MSESGLCRPLFLTTAICLFISLATAQIGPDPRWLNPNGSVSDFSTTFILDQSTTIAWSTLNNSRSDLYWTNWGQNSTFYVKVATNVDISKAGSLNYVFSTDDATLTAYSHEFNLRFWPLGAAFGALQFNQIISPGFLLARDSSVASTTTTSNTATKTRDAATSQPATATATTASATVTSTGTRSSGSSSTTTASDQRVTSDASLSGAAKAGIAIGVIVGLALLIGGGWFLTRQHRRQQFQPTRLDDGNAAGTGPSTGWLKKEKTDPEVVELSGHRTFPAELPATKDPPPMVHELA